MSTETVPAGPDCDAMISLIRETWPDAVVATIDGAAFFSLDDAHWPNFATVVWTDDFDEGTPSRLTRPGLYRVNVGVDRQTFERLAGAAAEPDFAAIDRFVPHPVYAKQRWISIINPSDATVQTTLIPLIRAAHDRLEARRAFSRERRRDVDEASPSSAK